MRDGGALRRRFSCAAALRSAAHSRTVARTATRALAASSSVISATCHCGAIRIDIPSPPLAATNCNCSICRRLGALWAFYPIDAVHIECAPDATEDYSWAQRTRRFVRCRHCGCTTHVEPTQRTETSKIEVNVRLFDPQALGHFRVRPFDGADSWRYLDDAPHGGGD